jgi:peptide deformylase
MKDLLTNGLKLRYWGDPVLSGVCEPVSEDEFGDTLEKLGQKMLEFITQPKYPDHEGIGLAAPQIGLAKRMFVMVRQDAKLSPIIAVNPSVRTYGEDVAHEEGCLSIPGVHEQVVRPVAAILHYQTPAGEQEFIDLWGYDAYCAQHETDHLDGIMFFDRTRMSRQLSKGVERRWEKERPRVLARAVGR